MHRLPKFPPSRKKSATTDAPLADSAVTLYLCRHGETTHNAAGLLQGHLDTSLNATGRSQAEALGAELRTRADAGLRFCSTVYSSDLGRASETAKASMRALGGEEGFTLSTTPQLRERGLGRFEGRTPADSKGTDIDSWRRFQRGQTVEGVEDTHALEKRVVLALRAIAAAHPGDHVLVFSHGGTIGSGLEQLLPLHAIPRITNCSISSVSLEPRDGGRCVAHTLSEDAHVAEFAMCLFSHVDQAAASPEPVVTSKSTMR